MKKLKDNTSQLTAICNNKGRVVALFYIVKRENEYLMILPKHMLGITQEHLKKYAMFSKVEFKDLSNEHHCYGEDSESLSEFISTKEIPEAGVENDWQLIHIKACIPTIFSTTSEKFTPHELNLANLEAIDFDKGCFLGQEIIARMHYRGKFNYHLTVIELSKENPVELGASITIEEKQKAQVVSIAEHDSVIFALVLVKEK